MAKSGGYVNLIMSQGPVHLDSCEPLLFTGQSFGVSTVKERRKWSPKEDYPSSFFFQNHMEDKSQNNSTVKTILHLAMAYVDIIFLSSPPN
ncbi:hypothetical protein YC2023_086635 [Brassica napus]